VGAEVSHERIRATRRDCRALDAPVQYRITVDVDAMPTLRIATRRSPLALWQAEHVRGRLLALDPAVEVELIKLVTSGDRLLDAPLAAVGGKGLFITELEQALDDGRADLAVHSMKDVPVDLDARFAVAAILAREDPRDVLIGAPGVTLDTLPPGARIGTSSLRRECQLRALRPDLDVRTLRGNVGTRIARLDAGDFDAIVLAAAGVERLGLGARVSVHLEPERVLPAIGQGAIGIECRSDALEVRRRVRALHDPDTACCVGAERALNRRLHGGCQVPIAGHAVLSGGRLTLRALVGRVDGGLVVRGERAGVAAEAERIGEALAQELLARGADAILATLGTSRT
jgi:hydroxymethylbilane synthase